MKRLQATVAIVCASVLFASGNIPFGVFPECAMAAETENEQELDNVNAGDPAIQVADDLSELQEYAPADLDRISDYEGDFATEEMAPYAAHRIIVYTDDQLTDTFGAVEASYYIKDGGYRLCYESDEATKSAYDALNAIYGTESVVLDVPLCISVKDEEQAVQPKGWGTVYMHLDTASQTIEKAQSGADVTVAVLDTGITSGHEVFDGETISDASLSLVDDSINDENGHGTAVSGIIAESTPANVDLLVIKIADAAGNSSLDYMLTGLDYAAEQGADVANISLNAYYGDTSLSDERIQGDIAAMEERLEAVKNQGVVICTSAGNDARDIDSVYNYPAMSEHVLCVGSINAKESKSSFSSYGEALDFTAPGEAVQCASIAGDSAWKSLSGTSMASPYIVAAAAMVKSAEQDADFSEVEEKLASISYDLGDNGRDAEYGYGVPIFTENTESVSADAEGLNETSGDITPDIENNPEEATLVDGITLPEGWDANDPESYKAYQQMYGDVEEEQIKTDGKTVPLTTASIVATTKWRNYGESTYSNFQHDSKNTNGNNIVPMIDVSYHNGTIDWKKVKADGIEGVIIRCGYRGSANGSLNTDTQFYNNIKGAKAAGLKVGVYFFSQAITASEGAAEADYSINLVKNSGVSLDLPVVIDIEHYPSSGKGRLGAANLSKSAQTSVAEAFCERAKSKGYVPMIYASSAYLVGDMNGAYLANKGYSIWMARYRYAAYSSSSIFYNEPVAMWQCTSQAAVNGINTEVDLNYWYGYFKDVTNPNDFWYKPIMWAVDEGITTGWADGTFRPWNSCNRAATATFLWRMAGRPEPEGEQSFSDKTGNAEFDKAISWADEQGITTGWSDGTFRPWNTSNRAAIVTFLWRYAGCPEPESIATFKDMPSDTAENQDFRKAISWAAEKGITTGWSDNTFRPWVDCNRAAIVTFLYRYANLPDDEKNAE